MLLAVLCIDKGRLLWRMPALERAGYIQLGFLLALKQI